ncbi:amidohydrolase family protein [Mycobacterium marseillense]|uniref:amidohydrolase family protein n=1 Tax=Mycobacterium marseillense TaxID=701042 RepID=UPI0011A151E1|nr:amidohydrolase family protein [Mycobacterium marseillense]
MRVDDLILISVDDHVVEPPSLGDYFRDHLPANLKDRAPKVIRRSDGTDAWLIEGREIATFGLNAVQGRPKESWGLDPANFDEVRPGTYDVHERVRDMNVNGVLASINFPSWPGLGGQFFAHSEDKEYVAAVMRAYNDWHLDEWCGAHPGRFIPIALSGFALGPEWMAGEIGRMAERGCHAVSFHPEVHRFGMPDLHGNEWDPAWRAAEEAGTVVVFHFGGAPNFMPRAPMDVVPHVMPFQTAIFAAELLWSPVLRNFPDVKLALAEGSTGWVPYFLEKADVVYEHHHQWTGSDFGAMLPSQYFKSRVQFCYIEDETGLRNRHFIGSDNIAWEADYPHSDSTWPHSPENAMKGFAAAGVPDDEIDKITWKNAARWYNFDPFEHRDRTDCTVGALRALADDVDTTPREYGSLEHARQLSVVAGKFLGGGQSMTLGARDIKPAASRRPGQQETADILDPRLTETRKS